MWPVAHKGLRFRLKWAGEPGGGGEVRSYWTRVVSKFLKIQPLFGNGRLQFLNLLLEELELLLTVPGKNVFCFFEVNNVTFKLLKLILTCPFVNTNNLPPGVSMVVGWVSIIIQGDVWNRLLLVEKHLFLFFFFFFFVLRWGIFWGICWGIFILIFLLYFFVI